MSISENVAQILLREKAVFLNPKNPFTWASGILSPVYCDNRILISNVNAREYIVNCFIEKIKPLNLDLIAGTATAGIPWAAWIAHELKLPLVYVRSSNKDHGRQNAIEGKVEQGQRAVLIEDLISTGKSSILAANKLEESGIHVDLIISIFSYQFHETQENFNSYQLTSDSLSCFEDLAKVAYNEKMLDTEALNQVLDWKKGVRFP
jgi:orotate phosphoribosyltransferase